MISEVSAAYGGIKAAFEIAKGISSLKSEVEINQAVIEIQHILLDAQSAALTDKEVISAQRSDILRLEKDISDNSQWYDMLQHYTLTRSELGCFTYPFIPLTHV